MDLLRLGCATHKRQLDQVVQRFVRRPPVRSARELPPSDGLAAHPSDHVRVLGSRHLASDELPRLLEQLLPHRRWWVVAAVYTTARRSVVERLRWDHVDLDGGWLAVPGTKTKGSDRMVPLHPFLSACLAGVEVAARRGPLVQPWPNVVHDLEAACARAGIAKVTPNDLRRSFASWLKQAGTDSMVVAKLLGHASTAMVERVYGHLGADNFRRAVDTLPAAGDEAGSTWVVTADVAQAPGARSAPTSRRARMRKPRPRVRAGFRR